jgi:hypothetical protein
MAEKLTTGKNALWAAYQDADQLVHDEILLELKKKGVRRHFYYTASKEGYDLRNAKFDVREIFSRLLPETAELFGLAPAKKTPAKPKPVPTNAPTLFDS